MLRTSGIIIILLCSMFVQAQKPVNIIFDTDMGPDYDDAGAIALLHSFADSGKARILATVASTKFEGVAAVLNVMNTYFRKPQIPVGVPKGTARGDLRDWQHWTDSLILNYPHAIKTNDEVVDAVDLYRQVLSAQPDNSVTIVTVGFLTNIAALLKTPGDKYSSLDGKSLVKKKVIKMVSMAGRFPAGLEFNIEEDHASAKYAFDNFPRPVLFTGFEIGEKIRSGLPLAKDTSISNSPVKDVFRICIPLAREDSAGRQSWDQTAVLIAVNGYEPYYTIKTGRIIIDAKGNNSWDPKGKSQAYVIEKVPPRETEAIINAYMKHQPLDKTNQLSILF